MNDSIDLLDNEIAKEEALLAKETKQLQEMEKNAKRAETERKRQMKNVCCLPRLNILELWLINDRNTPSYGRSRTVLVNKSGPPPSLLSPTQRIRSWDLMR